MDTLLIIQTEVP